MELTPGWVRKLGPGAVSSPMARKIYVKPPTRSCGISTTDCPQHSEPYPQVDHPRRLSEVREPSVREIDVRTFRRSLGAMLEVYSAAMAPPDDQLPSRHMIMQRHATY